MSYLGEEHANFMQNLTHGMAEAIRRQEHFNNTTNRANPIFENESKHAMQGAAIVTCLANVEYLIGKNPDGSWKIPMGWYGIKEFNYFRKMRHCFAHGAGRVLKDLKGDINNFITDLKSKKIVDREGKTVPIFFEVNKENRIIFTMFILERIRILCCELLAESGLLKKWY